MKQFFAELARRNVVRVSAAYVVLGWIILQVINNLVPATTLPGWSSSLLIVILLAGLPVVVIGAWAFELTPEGMKRTDASAAGSSSSLKGLDVALVSAALLVVAVSVLYTPRSGVEERLAEGQTTRLFDPRDGTPSFSVAVLPLNNLSDERAFEWIADGISEDITTRIASYQTLPVAARNSAFAFKEKSPDIREVGKALNVRFVLEGSLRPVGTDLRITAQLIDTGTGTHVWTSSYTHPLANIAQMQGEVVDVISIDAYNSILAYEIARLKKMPRSELTPFELTYLAINSAFNPGSTVEGVNEAIKLAEAALARDPDYLFARSFLAQLFTLKIVLGDRNSDTLVNSALEHLSYSLKEAPQDFWVLQRAANVMSNLGRQDDANRYARKLVDLYPDIYLSWWRLAGSLTYEGKYEEAQIAFDRFEALAGSRIPAYLNMLRAKGNLLLGLRDFEAAEDIAREALGYGEVSAFRLGLIVALIGQGKRVDASAALEIYNALPDAMDLATVETLMPLVSQDPTYIEMFLGNLRLAGME